MEFYRLEPFGDERADLRAGIIAATIANANRAKGVAPFKPQDFMPYLNAESERQKTLNRPKGKALDQKVRGIFSAMVKAQKS